MNANEIRRLNINYWADKLGRDVLAKKAGYADTVYINQLCGGHGSFGPRTARKLEAALGLDNGWFDRLHTTIAEKAATYELIDNIRQAPDLNKVPLLSWVQAGNWCESPEPPGTAEEWLDCPFPHSENAFCLEVVGDSMSPEYREGEYILVDPALQPEHNDDIVARTPDGTHTFKRIQITPEGNYLLALNPDHPARKIKAPEGTHICGVVTGSWMRRKYRRPTSQ
jgi:SOS-response transcriptional repressor LexA